MLHEEQAVYAWNNTAKKQQPPPRQQPAPKLASHHEHRQIPALAPDMSLWGAPVSAPEQHHHVPTTQAPTAPAGKRFMSLEEVEAQILAMNQKPPQQPLQAHIPTSQSMQHPFQHQIPQHTPSPGNQGPRYPPPGVDVQAGFPMQQLPPHLQHMINQNQNIPQHLQQSQQEQFARAQALQQQQQQQQQLREQHMLRQQEALAQQFQQQQTPVTNENAGTIAASVANAQQNRYGMAAAHIPAHELQAMSEAQRRVYLESESKRLKRNHKIAQLARYNGLMTPQDKNFIQRIQLQQLVSINNSEDNANEDFYYIVHSAIRARANPQQPLSQLAQTYLLRNGGRGNRRQDNHLQRMEQQVARAVAAAKARPKASHLVLEGSLGKISFSNVKTPRPMLNIKKPDSHVHEARATQRSTFSSADRKSLLRVIETVYDVLLELEMHERDRTKLPPLLSDQPPSDAHIEWDSKRDALATKLYAEMKVLEPIDSSRNSTHPFIAILSYSKMKRAIPRIFRHLDPEQRVTILTMIVVHLDILDVVKHGIYHADEVQLPSAFREEIEMFTSNVLPPLLSYMYEAPLSIAVGLLALLLERVNIRTISRTKIGLAFLTMFFSRAEIVKQSGNADDKDLADWQNIYDSFFEALNGHWMECFPPSGPLVDDQYVWQFLASMAVGANMQQQQILVSAVK